MRIAFLVDMFPKISETFILDQITGLLDLGHEVEIFTTAPSHEERVHPQVAEYGLREHTHFIQPVSRWLPLRLAGALRRLMAEAATAPGIVSKCLKRIALGPRAGAITSAFHVNAFLRYGPFDIVQCHFGHNGNLAAGIKNLGVPGKLVTMFHGYDLRRGMEEGGQIYADVFAVGDLFLSVTRFTTEHLIAFGAPPDRIVQHPVGIFPERFSFRWAEGRHRPRGAFRILTVARLVEEKGVDVGLSAVAGLMRDNPGHGIVYDILGGGPLEQDLRRLASELGIADSVRFLGPQSRERVAEVLRAADVFLLPSRAEVLPVAVMEAMVSGLPVVATRVGGVPELVHHGQSGLLVENGDSTAMRLALEDLFGHPEALSAMGKAGRDHVLRHYDNRKLSRRLEKIYEQLIEEPEPKAEDDSTRGA